MCHYFLIKIVKCLKKFPEESCTGCMVHAGYRAMGNGAAFVVGLAANLRSALYLCSQAGCVRTDCIHSPPIGANACPYCQRSDPAALWGAVAAVPSVKPHHLT